MSLLSELNAKIKTLATRVGEEFKAIRGEFAAADAALDTKITAAQNAANTAQGEVDALEGVVANLTQTVTDNKTAADTAIERVEGKADKNAEDIAALQGLVADKSDLEALAERVSTAEGEIDTLQLEMDAVEAKAAANETAIGTLTQTVASNKTAAETGIQEAKDAAAAASTAAGNAQATADEALAKAGKAYKYVGSVATVAALPSSGNTEGDVYNVEADGGNYAWNGTAWDALGGMITIDQTLNTTSTNAVSSKAVADYVGTADDDYVAAFEAALA